MRARSELTIRIGRSTVALAIVILALLILQNPVQAGHPAPREGRNLFVAPHGNDAWSGTSKRPWQTLARAARSVKPGDTVHVAPGVYTSPASIATSVSGSPTDRIRFLSDVKWGARLTTTARGYTFVWLNKGDYVDIEGFDISCEACSVGIRNMASNVRIIGNHVHDIPAEPGCTSNGGAGITPRTKMT
jgi:hypothetical protein